MPGPPESDTASPRASARPAAGAAEALPWRLGRALETAADAVVITDRACAVVWANAAAARLTGRGGGEPVFGEGADRRGLEVTESAAMTDVDATIGVLTALRGLGVHPSVDDFGTACSSLAYLRLLPIDGLKIDRSFVKDLADRPSDTPNEAAIVQSIVALGRSLSLKVAAEGIETPAQ